MALKMTEAEFAAYLRLRHPEMTDAQIKSCLYPPSKVPSPSYYTLPPEKPKRSKYGNRRVEVDGMKFDSQHEAQVYAELMLRVRAGELKYVLRQVPFDLPGGIRYYADFVAVSPDDRVEGVYDAKSEATRRNRVYINKRKQLAALYGIEIREV